MNTIMLIDDDPTMLRLLKTLLEIEGFKPATWSGSFDVISEIKEKKPNAILLDINLRGLNGIDILKEIRRDPAYQDIPIIMTSGMDYGAECRQAGASDFLVKPYMPDTLIRMIRTNLSQEV